MKIGILQTGRLTTPIIEHHGDFDSLFRNLLKDPEFEFETYYILDSMFPKSIIECDGWLITGSAHAVYDDALWIRRLEHFLQDAYDADVPIVGICFGHQVLAKALGGLVEKYKGGWAIGPQQYKFKNKDELVTINAWHQDQVTLRPKDAEVVASSSFCENAALLYKKTAYTIQAHPEFTNGLTAELIDFRRESQLPKLVEEAELKLTSSAPTPALAGQITSFFKTRELGIK